MAGRGNGDGGRGEDPDYDWIYGGSGDPEPTRRIPAQPRPEPYQPAEQRTPRLPPPEQQLGARPEPQGRRSAPPWAKKRSAWSRPRTYVRLFFLLLAGWLVFLVATPLYTWSQVEKVDYEPDGKRPGDQPGTTYLLVGSDSRAGLSPEERKRLSTGDAESELTDTILLLHTGDGPTTLISVPRDSPLDIPGHGVSKVNSAFAKGGTPLLVQTLEQATGVRIDGYVEIGFGGLVGVVDAVGGIEVCPKTRIRDPKAGLRIAKGCQEVDGATALAYSRSRKSPISDLARVQQQREVIAAVGDKVLSPWSVLNPVRYWKLNSAVPDFFRFGEGMSPIAAAQWARAMTNTPKSCTVPLASGDATWAPERAQKLFDTLIEDRTDDITADLCTASGLPE